MRDLILTLIIWIICFTAITVGVSMSYKIYKHRGKDVYITFEDVSGLVPTQSKVMFRGAEIGTVNDITLDLKTGYPVVKARIVQYFLPMLGKDSNFWIVRPEFGIGEIQNLSAISTGDYISVNPVPGQFVNHFIGLDESPVEDQYEAGLKIVLKADSAEGVDIGSSVLYRDLEIGLVGDMGLSKDKKSVLITLYIDKPYVNVIRKNSYFGNVSGFHASIHIFGGSEIGLNSLRTLVKGGITVVTPNFVCPVAKNGETFIMLNRKQFEEKQEATQNG